MKFKYIVSLVVVALTGCHHDINDLPVFKACKLVEINNFNSNGTRTRSTKYEYDKMGNLTKATTEQYAVQGAFSGLQTIEYQYDADNYLQTRISSTSGFGLTNPISNTLRYSYFFNGSKVLYGITQTTQTGETISNVITYTYLSGGLLPTSSVGGANNTLVTYLNGLTTSYTQNDNTNTKYTVSNGRIIRLTIGSTINRQYTYDSKGQLLNSVQYNTTTNQTIFNEYTYDNQLIPNQTQLNLKGHPIIAAIYGENINNTKNYQFRTFEGNGLNGRVLSQQQNSYIYTYNSKGLPVDRKVDNLFSDIKYTYTDCD